MKSHAVPGQGDRCSVGGAPGLTCWGEGWRGSNKGLSGRRGEGRVGELAARPSLGVCSAVRGTARVWDALSQWSVVRAPWRAGREGFSSL